MIFHTRLLVYKSLAQDNLLDVLRLYRTLNVGPVTFFNLVERFGTARNALDALPDLSLRGGRKNPLTAYAKADAEKEIASAQKFGAQFILYGTPLYPRLLHAIVDPPPVLTVVGHAHLWQKQDVVAMVGSRNASAAGCQMAQKMAKELGESGMTVVSGLARGIDTFVHKGALASGTVAVIAGGIDNIYPPENQALYAQITEAGAIISEQPFGSLPFAGAFPGRNRIIAGMSLGTVVVEASPKSGSLITARFAIENNRELFAVPGSPLDPRAKGCNQLIKQGACMAENAGDVLSSLAPLRGRVFEELPAGFYEETEKPAPREANDAELAQARADITEKLSSTPVSVDTLVEQCGIAAPVVLTVLLELELAGRARRSSGNNVYLTQSSETAVA